MKITVVGIGYVGLSNAILLAQHNEVIALDIDKDKVDLINKKISPISDELISEYLSFKHLNLLATTDREFAYKDAECIIISTPTNYDAEKDYFDTSSVERVIEECSKRETKALILIKSTIPVGFTNKIKSEYNMDNIVFIPEFLREGKALYDNLYPSRIIVGEKSKRGEIIAHLFQHGAEAEDIPVVYADSTEAEAIKLFANTYLAMRIAFFNELDSYAELNELNVKDIVEGISLDPRIGMYYNNPSFGYGGYCLPKDTKQLLANYKDIPQDLITAIVNANKTRKEHIAEVIIRQKPSVVGVYRLTMKQGSDNFRESAIQAVMEKIKESNIKILIYEPSLEKEEFFGHKVVNDLKKFKGQADLIIANRVSEDILDVMDKVYTRDLYGRD